MYLTKNSFNKELNQWVISDFTLCKKILLSTNFDFLVHLPKVHENLPSWFDIMNGKEISLQEKISKISYGILLNPFKISVNDKVGHKVLRDSVEPYFHQFLNPLKQEELRRFLKRKIIELQSKQSGFYLLYDYALPATTHGIMLSLGIREYDEQKFNIYSKNIYKLAGTPTRNFFPPDTLSSVFELMSFFNDYLMARKKTNEEGIIDQLLKMKSEGMIDTEEYFLTALAMFSGGYETTSKVISNALRYLFTDKEQLQYLLEHPDAMANVFWETTRLKSPTQSIFRKVNAPIVLDNCVFEKDQMVILNLHEAHQYYEKHLGEEVFDIKRKAHRNLAFGAGAHHCVAHVLGKVDVDLAVGEAVKSFSSYRLQEGEKLKELKLIP